METPVVSLPRKAGRPKRGATVEKFTVMLPRWLHEWAMQHPEGFTGLVRRLLLAEHASTPPASGTRPRPRPAAPTAERP
jgi:hypothetical protein